MATRPILPLLSGTQATLGETMRVLAERRRLLKLFGGLGALALLPRSPLACTREFRL